MTPVVATNSLLAIGCVRKRTRDRKSASPKNHIRFPNYNSEVILMTLVGPLTTKCVIKLSDYSYHVKNFRPVFYVTFSLFICRDVPTSLFHTRRWGSFHQRHWCVVENRLIKIDWLMLTVGIPVQCQGTIDCVLQPKVAQITFTRFFESAPGIYLITNSCPTDRCKAPCSVGLSPMLYFDSGDLECGRTLVL